MSTPELEALAERLSREIREELDKLSQLEQPCHCDRYSIGHIRGAECDR